MQPPQSKACPALAERGSSGIVAGMSITAVVENDTIKLPPGVHLPDGTEVSIETADAADAADAAGAASRGTLAERYAKFVGLADDLPEDMAKNHDHYLHGAPKRP